MNTVTKSILIGCGVIVLIGGIGLIALVVWLATGPEGGVKLGNEMEQYALEYIAEHSLLDPGEEILAYYDASLSMNGSEAAILTISRIIYHKNGNTMSIPVEEISDIRHRYESFIGDVIEIRSDSGRVMKIEIAPLNMGETFKSVLMETWRKARPEKPADSGEEGINPPTDA
jgi:hypothetical protein